MKWESIESNEGGTASVTRPFRIAVLFKTKVMSFFIAKNTLRGQNLPLVLNILDINFEHIRNKIPERE